MRDKHTVSIEQPGDSSQWSKRLLRCPWSWAAVPILAVVGTALFDAKLLPTPSFSTPTKHLATPSASPSTPAYRVLPELAAGLPAASAVGHASVVSGDGQADSFEERSVLGTPGPAETEASSAGGRYVVRKATLDLAADDVRGTYLKISKIVLQAGLGEYLEQAQLYDQEDRPQAYLTLRVRADRLDQALQTIRGLGAVRHEQIQAEDVTSRVVDIEAQLRNQKRIEQGLLTLLDKRPDSPLADVLKVSESLGQVRERIERLVANREQLAHQVEFATIVVTLNSTVPIVQHVGLAPQFKTAICDAWRSGIVLLISSVSNIIHVLLGGLIWWTALCVAVWRARRWYLHRQIQPMGQS